MGQKTGNPRGRPPGARNRRTAEVEAAAVETARVIEAALGDAFEGDAHALLMSVYKNPAHDWNLRIDAAKAAIRYERPALSAVEANVNAKVSHDEWVRRIASGESVASAGE